MGKKRKHERSEEEIRRKIRKLKNQLANKTANEGTSSSEEIPIPDLPADTPYYGSPYCESALDAIQYDEPSSYLPSPGPPSPSPRSPHPLSPRLRSPHPPSPRSRSPHPPSPRPASPDNVQNPASLPPQPGPSADKSDELELDDDILQLLGDAPKSETPLGPPVHKDVARRWQDILAKGLSKDVKESLLKEYMVPNNCDLLLAPALNPEVKAALPDALVKRDSSLVYKQKQLGTALSALATVTEMVIANETSKQKLLKPLSDACRILCDSHYAETRTRRGFVISSINTKLKDALIESSRDKLLFGENVSEKLKAAKTIQQSGEALKNAQKQKFVRQNIPSTSGNKGNLNFMPQHRKTDNRPVNNRRATSYSQRQTRSNNSTRRPSDHPLPGKSSSAHHRR